MSIMRAIQMMKFSEEEGVQLLRAWAAISFAFAVVLSGGSIGGGQFVQQLIIAGITVGLAFLLHELAHKFMAQRYGCWAEFRAFDMGLLLAVAVSFLGFIVAAPGAVMIGGMVSERENGHIAVAGPITNLVLAALFYITFQFLPGTMMSPLLAQIITFGFAINAWLAFFNLIPFGPLDGAKVMAWSTPVWGTMIAIAAALTFIVG